MWGSTSLVFNTAMERMKKWGFVTAKIRRLDKIEQCVCLPMLGHIQVINNRILFVLFLLEWKDWRWKCLILTKKIFINNVVLKNRSRREDSSSPHVFPTNAYETKSGTPRSRMCAKFAIKYLIITQAISLSTTGEPDPRNAKNSKAGKEAVELYEILRLSQ